MSNSKKSPFKGAKVSGTPLVQISPEDALETAEMIRAAHTLSRMAFGASTLVFDAMRVGMSDEDKKVEAETLNKVFNDFMGTLRSVHEYYAKIYAARPKDDVQREPIHS